MAHTQQTGRLFMQARYGMFSLLQQKWNSR